MMSTTGARYGSKIDSTRDRDEPFTFLLGDENIIQGLQVCDTPTLPPPCKSYALVQATAGVGTV